MKIFQINGAVFGSTGKIMLGIAKTAKKMRHEVVCAAPITKTNRHQEPPREYIKIGTYHGRRFSVLLSRITGLDGCFAIIPTLKLLGKIKKFQPDVIHLHNLHGSYLNLPLLFRYIKKHSIRTVWTLHDCWAFTGHCSHFDMIGCDKWQDKCFSCPQYRDYPKSYVDNSRYMHYLKKRWFLGVDQLTLVTPSQWLANVVKASFLGVYPVRVINNGIDLSVFKPTPSDFRKKYGLSGKKIILGVADGWSDRKGLVDFLDLSKRLSDQYRIVLVGMTSEQIKILPSNVIGIERTESAVRLAEIYTAADVFVNPSREETMGLVTAEALACGTPAIVYDRTAVPEVVDDSCGFVVPAGNIEKLIKKIEMSDHTDKEASLQRAKAFEMTCQFQKYIEQYETSFSR